VEPGRKGVGNNQDKEALVMKTLGEIIRGVQVLLPDRATAFTLGPVHTKKI
jgi:hypothetical protein